MMDSYTFANYFNSASHNNGGGDVFSPEVMQKCWTIKQVLIRMAFQHHRMGNGETGF